MAKKKEKKPLELMEMHFYIRRGDELLDYDKLTPEQQKQISQELNEQAARTIVLRIDDETA